MAGLRQAGRCLRLAATLTSNLQVQLSTPASLATNTCIHANTRRGLSNLAYEELEVPGPSSTPPDERCKGVIVHGLLGSGRNWRTFSRRLANEAATASGRGWDMLLVDQRNHGRSSQLPDLPPPHTIQSSATDLRRFAKDQFDGRRLDALIGHSLGGKTVLEFLRQTSQPDSDVPPPKQVWVLDAAVRRSHNGGPKPRAESNVEKVVKELSHIPTPIPSREWLYKYLGERGYSPSLQQWLGSNLVGDKNGTFRWVFNIGGATDMLESYYDSDYWDLLTRPPPGVDIHHVRAANSDRWTQRAVDRLSEAQQKAAEANTGGSFHAHVLPDAGHWLHVDNPDGLLKMILPYIKEAC